MSHLDAARWKALQEAPDEALLAHVAEGCEVCDAFLESLPGFDGEVDRALLALAPRAPSTDELSWARYRRQANGAPATRRFDLRAPAAKAERRPWPRVKSVTMRSASPKSTVESTSASSENRSTGRAP